MSFFPFSLLFVVPEWIRGTQNRPSVLCMVCYVFFGPIRRRAATVFSNPDLLYLKSDWKLFYCKGLSVWMFFLSRFLMPICFCFFVTFSIIACLYYGNVTALYIQGQRLFTSRQLKLKMKYVMRASRQARHLNHYSQLNRGYAVYSKSTNLLNVKGGNELTRCDPKTSSFFRTTVRWFDTYRQEILNPSRLDTDLQGPVIMPRNP